MKNIQCYIDLATKFIILSLTITKTKWLPMSKLTIVVETYPVVCFTTAAILMISTVAPGSISLVEC